MVTGMGKIRFPSRILSLLVAIIMLLGIFPVFELKALAAAPPVYVPYVSLKDGTGFMTFAILSRAKPSGVGWRTAKRLTKSCTFSLYIWGM